MNVCIKTYSLLIKSCINNTRRLQASPAASALKSTLENQSRRMRFCHLAGVDMRGFELRFRLALSSAHMDLRA